MRRRCSCRTYIRRGVDRVGQICCMVRYIDRYDARFQAEEAAAVGDLYLGDRASKCGFLYCCVQRRGFNKPAPTCGGRACSRGREEACFKTPPPSLPPPPLATRWTLPMSHLSLLSPRGVLRASRIPAAAEVIVTACAVEWIGLSLIAVAGARKQKQLAGEARRASVAATMKRMAMTCGTPSEPAVGCSLCFCLPGHACRPRLR